MRFFENEVKRRKKTESNNPKQFNGYDSSQARDIFESYHAYLSEDDSEFDYKEAKKELKSDIKQFGLGRVVKSLIKSAVGIETAEGSLDNEDCVKCELSEMLKDWKIKIDEETKKMLKYNPKKVWWL